ncbi:MAG TPA: acyl-CoA dehydrogenase family protein [Candidatus Limnocylindrales bacterium]|nr:acyl-CoA dehydrogenase family protein [Candidatus Limnocylindrales bacterium]
MVPWPLSPVQEELQARARAFAESELEPIAEASDRQGAVPDGLADRFHATGLPRTFLVETPPDEFVTRACLVAEQLSYACAALASFLMLPIFFNRVVLTQLAGTDREDYLKRCLAAPVVTSFAASEAGAGSDLLALETTATRTPTGYTLTGRKEYSSNLRAAHNVIVVARTGAPGGRASDAMSWFLVPTTAAGLRVGERWPTFGLRAIDVSPLELSGVEVPASHLLGEEGRGLAMMGGSLAQSRIGIAALGVGIARRARDLVMAHGKRRRLYGDKLSRLQDYRFRIADMEKRIAAARALVWVAAQRADRGQDATKESSIAKLYAGEMVMDVTSAASGMLGSIGYTGQTQVEKLLRDARHVAIVEGTEPTHKELIFAHSLRHGGY